ncbi:MAG: hypothetical protein F6K40_21625, partial [Okeania sp. SIO3I5]|uniref:hypothetical protein n=1 Tax=Okeania sp. SIO3I5 TaxID=2607805 RepID=UPI0013BA81A3
MSVFRNIVVVGVIGVVISNAGQGSSTPLPTHSQNNTPENSILDPKEVKEKSVEVKETQGVKSDINSVEKVAQLRPQGSLLEKLKSNSSGRKVQSNRDSEVNINQELPKAKPDQEIISALKELENIYKNTDSLLAELKSRKKGENSSASGLEFKQNINRSFAVNNNQEFNIDSKNSAELGKSNSSLLDLLESKSGNSEVENPINPPVETNFKQSIILEDKDSEKFNPDSKNSAELGKSNSSLLDLLESKPGNSEVETEINPTVETNFQQSIILEEKDTEKFHPDSKNLADIGNNSNSSLLDLLESKPGNSEVETEINPTVETNFQQSIILEEKDTEKFHPDSKNLADIGNKSNSSLLDLLESKPGNSEVETEINPTVETNFQQSIILEEKDTEKFHPDSKNLADIGNNSNSSLLDLLESKPGNSEVETEINPTVETNFQQSIILEDKDTEKFNPNSKKLADIGNNSNSSLGNNSNSSLLDLLESKPGNSEVETEINPTVETNFQQSIILEDKDTENFHPDSKNLADIGNNSNSSLLDLLESKPGNSEVETEINPTVETNFQQSIILEDKDTENFHPDSKNLADIGNNSNSSLGNKSNSSLLDLLESKPGNSEVETEINPTVETNFQQSIILEEKDTENFHPDSKNLADIGNNSNSSLLDLLESKPGNSEVETEINPTVETNFQQSIILADKDSEKFNPESKKSGELGKSNSSLLDLLESKSGNSEVETEINPTVETNFQQSIILEEKDTEKFHPNSKKLADIGNNSNSSLLDLLESKPGNSEVETEINPTVETN